MIAIIALVVFTGLGINRKAARDYWLLIVLAAACQPLAGFLFAGGGTLGDPSGDGVVTQLLRAASDDGPAVVAVAPFAIGLGWVVPIYLISRAWKTLPPEKAQVS